MRLQSKQIISLNKEIYWRILDVLPDKENGESLSIEDLAKKIGLSENYLKNNIVRHLENIMSCPNCAETPH